MDRKVPFAMFSNQTQEVRSANSNDTGDSSQVWPWTKLTTQPPVSLRLIMYVSTGSYRPSVSNTMI